MAGELTDEKLGAMVLAGIGAFPHGSMTPFTARDIGACALMVGDLRNEVASLRTVLNDLLLTRQAHREAYAEEMRLADTFHHFENVEGLAEADDRTAETEQAHEAAWDRARSLLAGEEKNGD